MGIKGYLVMYLIIVNMIMKFIYRMLINLLVCEYIKFCVIFMEKDILLLIFMKYI